MITLWLVIGTVVMLAATLYFIFLGFTSAPQGSRHFYFITALITLIAFVAYLSMSTGQGVIEASGEAPLYQARYIDWLFTTPLLLLDLALLALAAPRRRINLIAALIGLDVLMILIGWWAGATASGAKYVLWFISLAAMVALLYLILTQLFTVSTERPDSVRYIFRTLSIYTVVLWALYPVVWLLGAEGIGTFGLGWEVFLFLVLDILSKVGFGFLLLTNRPALEAIGSGGAQARPSRVQ